jgi:DNA-binding transcriptional ArsR family regulator
VERRATLDLAELERRPVRVEVSPAASLFALAADAVGAHRGAPGPWLARVRAQLDRDDLAALIPLAVRPGGFTPASVMPGQGRGRTEIAEELDRIAELPVETLLADIAFACGPSPDGAWGAVARRPRRWLPRYARALRKAWRGVREPWAAAAELFDREVGRVGVASATGATAELLTAIHPRALISGGQWMLPDPDLRRLRLPEEGLTLIPILGGSDAAGAGLRDDGTLDWIVYPLVEAWRGPAPAATPARLEALLGSQRARVLRALDSPRTIGRLAQTLIAVPSAATHHVDSLELAGLVARERDGRYVIVHRTERGSRLVGLYPDL